MKSATAISTHDEVGLRMDVNNAADTGEVVSLERRQHVDIPSLRAPDLHLPGSVHGAREEDVGDGGVPGQSERGQPPARVVVVFYSTLREDVGGQFGGVVKPQGVVTAEGRHLVSSLAREDTAGERPRVT